MDVAWRSSTGSILENHYELRGHTHAVPLKSREKQRGVGIDVLGRTAANHLHKVMLQTYRERRHVATVCLRHVHFEKPKGFVTRSRTDEAWCRIPYIGIHRTVNKPRP